MDCTRSLSPPAGLAYNEDTPTDRKAPIVLYNVSQLLKDPVGATRSYLLDEAVPALEEGWEPLHLTGTVDLLRTNRSILVTAHLKTALTESCSRCLEPHQEPLIVEVEEEFFPKVDVYTGAPLEVPEEGVAFTISERHLLDLHEAVRQAVLLARPIQPLCRPDCPGLCPECGEKREQGACDCLPQSTDVRWAALRQMLG